MRARASTTNAASMRVRSGRRRCFDIAVTVLTPHILRRQLRFAAHDDGVRERYQITRATYLLASPGDQGDGLLTRVWGHGAPTPLADTAFFRRSEMVAGVITRAA